ncbi:MAG: barstar family protein, partial [Catenulispora sp.]
WCRCGRRRTPGRPAAWKAPPPEAGSGAGILTVFEHGDAFARADRDAYDMALEIWEEAAEEWWRIGVPFTVLLRLEA